jgi:hypothetical protein
MQTSNAKTRSKTTLTTTGGIETADRKPSVQSREPRTASCFLTFNLFYSTPSSWWCGARMMAIRAKMLKKKPIANQLNTLLAAYPFFIEIIVHAIEHTMLTTSTNSQLAGSIIAIGNN